jgi:hypothetical protein
MTDKKITEADIANSIVMEGGSLKDIGLSQKTIDAVSDQPYNYFLKYGENKFDNLPSSENYLAKAKNESSASNFFQDLKTGFVNLGQNTLIGGNTFLNSLTKPVNFNALQYNEIVTPEIKKDNEPRTGIRNQDIINYFKTPLKSIEENYSLGYKDKKFALDIQAVADDMVLESEYQKDMKDSPDTPVYNTLKDVGKRTLNTFGRLAENPSNIVSGAIKTLPTVVASAIPYVGQATMLTSEAGGVVSQVAETINSISDKQMMSNPEYAKLRETLSENDAKAQIIEKVSPNAFALGLATSYLGSRFTGNPAENLVQNLFTGNTLKNLGKGIFKENIQELAVEVPSNTYSNYVKQDYVPETKLTDGLGETIANTVATTTALTGALGTPGLLGSVAKDASTIQANRSDAKNPNGEQATKNAINKLNTSISSITEPTKQNTDTYTGSEFSKSLNITEGGNYDSDNKLEGYSRGIGSIQFIANRLQALKPKLNGLVTDEDFIKVKEENGNDGYRYTDQFIQRFKNNENGIQDLANEVQFKTLDEETKPYEKYIGQTIQGVEVTKSGLMASAHLGGVGGLRDFLTGNSNAKDANNTSIATYMQKHGNKDIYSGSSQQIVTDPQTTQVSEDIITSTESTNTNTTETEEIVLTPEEKQQDVLQITSKEDKDDQFVNNLPKKVKTTVSSSGSKPDVVKNLVTDIKANVYTDIKETNSAKLLAVSEYDKLVQYVTEAEENGVTDAIKTVINNTSKDIKDIRESITFPDDFSLNHIDFDTTFKFAKVSPSKVSINYLNKLFDGSNESNEFLGTMKPNKVETLRNLHEQNTIVNDNILKVSKDTDPKNTAKVSQEIRDTGFNGDQKLKKSLDKHLNDFNILNSGGIALNEENQLTTLEETVQGIQNFAIHMKGKAEALTESGQKYLEYKQKNPDKEPTDEEISVKYDVWNGKRWYSKDETTTKGIFHKQGKTGEGFVKALANNAMVFSDAYRTIRTYNSIARKYNKANKENQLEYITLPDAPKDIKNYSQKLNKSFSEQQKSEQEKDKLNYYSGSDSNIRKSQKFIDPTLKKESGEKDTKKESKPKKAKKTTTKKDSKPVVNDPVKQDDTVTNVIDEQNPPPNTGEGLIDQADPEEDNETPDVVDPNINDVIETNNENYQDTNNSKVKIFKGFWTREEVSKETDKIFLFGDNTNDRVKTKHIPTSTQAIIRGLPNALGIDTKKDRGTSNNSYFSNNDFDIFKTHVDEQIQFALDSGLTIVIPEDGIGTGKAQLNEKAPKLAEYLNSKLEDLIQGEIENTTKTNSVTTKNDDDNSNNDSDLDTDVTTKVDEITTNTSKPKIMNIWYSSQENSWLSNLAKRKFTFLGIEYLSVEHAYQTVKSGKFSKKTYNNPGWIKGGKHGQNDTKANTTINPDTGISYNVELMKDLIKESFIQNPDLKEKLIALGDVKFTHTQDTGMWKTKFPELLTQVKQELTDEDTTNLINDPKQQTQNTNNTNTEFDVLNPSYKRSITYKGKVYESIFHIYKTYLLGNGKFNKKYYDPEPNKIKTSKEEEKIIKENNKLFSQKNKKIIKDNENPLSEKDKELLFRRSDILFNILKEVFSDNDNKDLIEVLNKINEDTEIPFQKGEVIYGYESKLLDIQKLLKPIKNNEFDNEVDRENYVKEKILKDLKGKDLFDKHITFNKNINSLEYILNQLKENSLSFFDVFSNVRSTIIDKLNSRVNMFNFNSDNLDKRKSPEFHVLNFTKTYKKNEEYYKDQKAKVSMLGYNNEIISKALLAFSLWFSDLNPEDKRFYNNMVKGENDIVTLNLDEEDTYISRDNVATELTKYIKAVLGISFKDNTPLIVSGMIESLAKEILTVISQEQDPIIKFTKAKIQGSNKEPYLIEIDKETLSKIKENIKEFNANSKKSGINILKEILNASDFISYSIGSPIVNTSTTIKNSKNLISEPQKELLNKLNSVPNYLNKNLFEVLIEINKDRELFADFRRLFVRGFNPKKINVNTKKTIEGKQQTLNYNLTDMTDLAEEVYNLQDESDVDIPVYVKHEINAVGRADAQRFSGQSNKMMREILNPNKSTFSLDDEELTNFYFMAIAQAFGAKTEYKSVEESKQYVRKFYNENKDLLLASSKKDYKKVIELLSKKDEITEVYFHAVIDFGRYLTALDNKDIDYTTSIYLESDGKTDGPGNMLVNFDPNPITIESLRRLFKVGYFIGSENKTLSKYYEEDTIDLYKETVNKLQNKIIQDHEELKPVLFLFAKLGLDVTINTQEETITIERGFGKQPMTKVGYGAGISGLSNGLVYDVADTIYSLMTEYLNTDTKKEETRQKIDSSIRLLNKIINQHNLTAEKKVQLINEVNPREYTTFSFSDNNIESISKSLTAFSEVFMDTIKGKEGVLGNTTSTMDLIKDITQKQSIYAQEVFKQKINEYVEPKEFETKKGKIVKYYPKEELTLGVLDNIFKELQNDGILPEYKSDLINLYIGYAEKVNFGNNTVETSDSLPKESWLPFGSYTTQTKINSPVDARVSGIPDMNIGTGDGLMMLTAFINDLVTNALNVYDGLNSGINDIKDNSLGINQAVYMGYQTDHLQPLIDSTEKFINALNTKYKNTEIMVNNKNKDLALAIKLSAKDIEGDYELTSLILIDLNNHLKDLINNNTKIMAKKKVLGRIKSSIDHMASANVPYVTDPENAIDVSNLDEQQLVDKINEEINEEINKELGIEPIKQEVISNNKPLIIKTKEDLNDLIPEKDLIDNLKDAYAILKKNITVLANTNITIKLDDKDVKTEGVYEVETDTIKVSKNVKDRKETLLHELLHGLTAKKVILYYINKKLLSEQDRQALEAIELQMKQFLKINPESVFTQKFGFNNENVVNYRRLAEFITYVLTSLKTQELAKKTEASLTETIINKVKQILNKVFGLSVYDVVLFNTNILAETDSPNMDNNIILDHISDQDMDLSVKTLNIQNEEKVINAYKEGTENTNIQNKFNELTNAGFNFTEEESIRFYDYLTIFNKAVLNNNNIVNSMNKIFSKIIENLTIEDFLNTAKNMNQAKEQYDLITNIKDINSFGSILGLYQLNENFANAIKDISLKKKLNKDQSIDRLFEDLASTGIDLLNGINRQPTVGKSLEMINEIVLNTKPRKELYNIPNNYLSQANQKTYNVVSKGLRLLASKSRFFSPIESIYNKELSIKYAEDVINGLNKASIIPLGFKELVKEFIGKIPLTAEIENMLKLVKSQVQAVRQGIVVELPKILANNFKTKMKLSNWSTLYNTIGISDILSINDNVFDTIEMIKNNSVIEQIRLIEKKLNPRYIEKSKQLANYIINKEEGNNLLRNSYAIARLLNETDTLNADPSEDIIKLIDDLVSLYSYELLSDDIKKDFNDLITNDREAVEYLANTVKEIQKTEKEKALTGYAKYTHLKGYLPENIKDGKRIIIAEDTDYKNLVKNGYTRIGDYTNSAEKSIVKKGYYYSDVIGSGYVSGILQTINQSASGVDPVTGKMLSHRAVNKLITGSYVNVLNKRLSQNKSKNSGFIPVFDANGKLYAYERTINKDILSKLNPNEELHKVIAILKGRQEEEKLAEEFNKVLIDRAFELKEKDYPKNKDSYINLSISTDPIHQDIWNVIPKTTKQYINKVFGKNQFYIRKELLNNMVGYRVPSIQDLFSGKSRFDKKTQETFQKLVMTVFGDKAFKYLATTEKGLQSLVSFTKESIVVKSIAVPTLNFLANIVELSSFGVSIVDISRYMLEGFTDLNTHIKNNKRKLKIQSDLLATNDPIKKDKLNKELQAINVIESNLKIKPLLDAGEFNTIVEEADIGIDDALVNNGISDWIENQINKLPSTVRTIARYSVISKNTALYKGLSRSIQYGDFLSKYALYQYTKKDEKTKNPLLTNKDLEKLALEQISEAFVDYNFNSGRIGTGLDLYGLTLFKTYRIRITKIALRLIRDKPVTTLLSTLLGNTIMPVGTGSLLEDNIFGGINTNGWNNIIDELSQPSVLKVF